MSKNVEHFFKCFLVIWVSSIESLDLCLDLYPILIYFLDI